MKYYLVTFIIMLSLSINNGSAQVTKSNNVQGIYNGSSDTRSIPFDISDFGSNPSIDRVTVLIEFSSQDSGIFGITFHEDIAFRLESPMGSTVDLVYDARGFYTGNLSQPVTYGGFDPTSTVQVTFDDTATMSVASSPGGNPTTGVYIPIEPLSVFNNESPIGNWTLHIADSFDNGFDDELFFFYSEITIYTPTLGNNDADYFETKVLPTLVKDHIKIKSNSVVNNLTLYSMTGELVSVLNLNTAHIYDLSDLNSGLYFIKIDSDKGQDVKKIIKK